MNTKIRFTYEGIDYVLEYTRRSIATMEERGFVISDVNKKPMSNLPKMFSGAFLANHKHTKQGTIDAIYDKMPNKESLFEKLTIMYTEAIEALMDEPEETEGNIQWEAGL